MSGVGTKPFLRFSSLVRMKNRGTPYQTWEQEDEDNLDSGVDMVDAGQRKVTPSPATTPVSPVISAGKQVVQFTTLATSTPILTNPVADGISCQEKVPQFGTREKVGAAEQELVECFYLGSYEMSGLEIQGRGCIDLPAAVIWQQSQDQEKKPKRIGSWSGRQQHSSSKNRATCNYVRPRYVKLVTASNNLSVQDQGTEEIFMEFNYEKISFVGTHPKQTRLFAFIAVSSSMPAPYCHAFKCEDGTSAKKAACMLSDVFSKKIKELLQKSKLAEGRNDVG